MAISIFKQSKKALPFKKYSELFGILCRQITLFVLINIETKVVKVYLSLSYL
ncbi:hypothetical protein SAMN04487944_12712 [Gracilibacillus ureilyticus]|uniref:Uncharacterized protein n=1 Tax=Gracilibacillus ureilyticus TaxID=531814 RepID=A0A1H9VTB7_9BACI|nr:hypothetical protein SAMN04487944_12712 [Gracilibacillus ureilyticus]